LKRCKSQFWIAALALIIIEQSLKVAQQAPFLTVTRNGKCGVLASLPWRYIPLQSG
jgi:hypothetical protein